MPVSVILGGDPVYTYSATAPLPENIDEYILAGFLRGSKVKMVKCISNDIYVPEDADIVLEGYVDTGEYLVWEGPFGDHTGFYSLADWYPKFHITCITHASDAVYPATIVGIPPQEDAYLAKATEKIFLSPIKLSLQPEIEDLHMPDAGVAHNLVLAKIRKSYPGQGMKIINSLLGAGQMMFTKYLVVLDGDINIRNYDEVMRSVLSNTDFSRDIFFCRGPLDVLDHSSDSFAFGGKMGIDATVKTRSESADVVTKHFGYEEIVAELNVMVNEGIIRSFNFPQSDKYLPVLILSAEVTPAEDMVEVICRHIAEKTVFTFFRIIVLVDHTVDVNDLFTVAWQVLGNSDPFRDHKYISGSTLMIDGTIKFYRPGGFARRWPNVVLSEYETIKSVDKKWPDLALGDPVPSPSLKYMRLQRPGREEISNS